MKCDWFVVHPEHAGFPIGSFGRGVSISVSFSSLLAWLFPFQFLQLYAGTNRVLMLPEEKNRAQLP